MCDETPPLPGKNESRSKRAKHDRHFQDFSRTSQLRIIRRNLGFNGTRGDSAQCSGVDNESTVNKVQSSHGVLVESPVSDAVVLTEPLIIASGDSILAECSPVKNVVTHNVPPSGCESVQVLGYIAGTSASNTELGDDFVSANDPHSASSSGSSSNAHESVRPNHVQFSGGRNIPALEECPTVSGSSPSFEDNLSVPMQASEGGNVLDDMNLTGSGSMPSSPVLNVVDLGVSDLISLLEQADLNVDFDTITAIVESEGNYNVDNDFDPTLLFTEEVTRSNSPHCDSLLDQVLKKFDDDEGDDGSSADEAPVRESTLGRRVEAVLKDWALIEREKHTKVTSLLKGLKALPELSDLPATASALVGTPRNLKSVPVPSGGSYYHFGLTKCLVAILKGVKSTHVVIYVSTDGVSLYKSAPSELWPVMGRIISVESVSHIVFPIGFYYGARSPEKPEYLEDFVREAEPVIEEGLSLNGEFFSISVTGLICDAPGRAMALGVLYPTGKVSCTKCHVTGIWSISGNRVYFDSEDDRLRTHQEFLDQTDKAYHKFYTPLVRLRTLTFPSSISLDFMHLTLQGCGRTIVYLWLIGKVPHKIGAHQKRKVCERMKNLKYFSPSEFGRKPRDMKEAKMMKATEWYQILCYTGMVVFRGQVPSAKYDSFLCLCVAMRIILDPKNKGDQQMIDYAQSLLLFFIQSVRELYGQDFITHNFHQLAHICGDLSHFDNLQDASMFRFENFMQFVISLVRKSSDVLEQLARRLEELYKQGLLFKQQVARVVYEEPQYFSVHQDGPLLGTVRGPQYRSLKFKFFKLSTTAPDNCCTIEEDRIIHISNFCCDRSSNKMMILGYQFASKGNFFTTPCNSSLIGIYEVSNLSSTLRAWPVETIRHKNYLMPLKQVWVAVPLLYSDF